MTYHPEFYLMKHLCHSVVPGSYRLEISGDNENALAFINPDGRIVVVMVNRSDNKQTTSLSMNKQFLNLELPPHSFHTIIL